MTKAPPDRDIGKPVHESQVPTTAISVSFVELGSNYAICGRYSRTKARCRMR
jgi:hypothetical protein